MPANKLIHVRPGAFYGSYSVEPEVTRLLPVSPPALWLPVEDLSYSPSEPLALDLGPYKNQLLIADVTYGGLTRAILQQVNGQYQGCALPFTQGLEAGINRARFGPDGSLYVGGIGNPGTWAQEGKLWHGLQRLEYTGAPAFELLEIELRSDGLLLTFTEPLHWSDGDAARDYTLTQWHYVATEEYGGPRVGQHELPVRGVHVSADRRRVFLEAAGIAPGHVVHVHLARPPASMSHRELWAADAYCTINELPRGAPGPREAAPPTPPNALSAAEERAGLRLLFDGASLAGLRDAAGGPPRGWTVRDGWLTARGARGGDLVTAEDYADFELSFEWRVDAGSNGGVFYRALTATTSELWTRGVEFQIVDDASPPSAPLPLHRSGAAYDLFAPELNVVRPASHINHGRVVARGAHVEHWVNGHRVARYEVGSDAWRRQLAHSKLRARPQFGASPSGQIGLQHGAGVAYRDLKLRPLEAPPR